MRTSLAFFMGVLFLSVASGCSLITDFDNDGNKEDGAPPDNELYSIDDNLPEEVTVLLDETDIGTLELALDEPLPNADQGDEELVAMLGGSIQVVVRSIDVGTSFSLMNGSPVASAPAQPGQYTISPTADRKKINIQFFNEIDGHSLQPGPKYAATFAVVQNKYFETGNFVRDVTVVR